MCSVQDLNLFYHNLCRVLPVRLGPLVSLGPLERGESKVMKVALDDRVRGERKVKEDKRVALDLKDYKVSESE